MEEAVEGRRLVLSRIDDGSPSPSMLCFFFITGSLGAGAGGTTVPCGLGAPISKLLPDSLTVLGFSFSVLVCFFSFFSFLLPSDFAFVLVVVTIVFVFVIFVMLLPSLSEFMEPMFAQLFMRASERIERIARTAIDPPPDSLEEGATGPKSPDGRGCSGGVRSAAMDEMLPLRSIGGFGCNGTPNRERPASRELKRARDSVGLNGSGAKKEGRQRADSKV